MDKIDKMNKKNLIIITVLMLISGLLIYYLYLKPEKFSISSNYTLKYSNDISSNINNSIIPNSNTDFENCANICDYATNCKGIIIDNGKCILKDNMINLVNSTTSGAKQAYIKNTELNTQNSTTCPTVITETKASIISKTFGIGFNIYPIMASTTTPTIPIYLIEHIPINYNNTLGSMYAISKDGLLTIQLRNEKDPSQWWQIIKINDTTYVINPFNIASSALQYENGSLALRPYTSPGFPGQQWQFSSKIVTRGIPVLNFNPASMFTTEFDPYSTTNSITGSSLDQHNTQQVSDVVSAIKSGIQQYLTQSSNDKSNTIQQVSASSLGNKELPLHINLKLGNNTDSNVVNTLSKFADITGTTTNKDFISLLDKYEQTNDSSQYPQYLYTQNDLQTVLQSNTSCTPLNLNEYTSNRVSSCNCGLF